jgi:hypothetical protein
LRLTPKLLKTSKINPNCAGKQKNISWKLRKKSRQCKFFHQFGALGSGADIRRGLRTRFCVFSALRRSTRSKILKRRIFMPEAPRIPIANINHGGGQPIVEVFVGNAHWGKYEIFLRTRDPGNRPRRIGEGVTSDNIPDVAPIADPIQGLNGTLVFWRAIIADPSGRPGGTFIITVRVMQDGNVVGMDAKTGSITGASIGGFIQLGVV